VVEKNLSSKVTIEILLNNKAEFTKRGEKKKQQMQRHLVEGSLASGEKSVV
jgi:hypothetical protein